MDRIKVLIDTDIGDDIDDALALALALNSPELDIVGITTVYGKTDARARLAAKILEMYGRDDIPVAMGSSKPLVNPEPKYFPKQALIIDKKFRPYFYVLPRENIDVNKLIARIKMLSSARSPITSVEIVEKKYFGKPVKVLKVKTVIPDQVPKYREEIRKMPEVKEVLEADIRFSMRYLLSLIHI